MVLARKNTLFVGWSVTWTPSINTPQSDAFHHFTINAERIVTRIWSGGRIANSDPHDNPMEVTKKAGCVERKPCKPHCWVLSSILVLNITYVSHICHIIELTH